MCVSVDSLIEVLLFNLQEFALKKKHFYCGMLKQFLPLLLKFLWIVLAIGKVVNSVKSL